MISPTDPAGIRLEMRNLDIAFGRRPPPGAIDGEGELLPGERPFRLTVPRFTASGGSLVGVAGRSGEGKSTLLHVLALLLPAPDKTAAGDPFGLRYEWSVRPHGGAGPVSPGADGKGAFAGLVPASFGLGSDAGIDAKAGARSVEQARNEAFGFIFQQAFLLPYFNVVDNLALPHMLRHGYDRPAAASRAEDFLREFRLPPKHWKSFPSELSGGQNQRLAVGRALIHEPPFLFADEPTANLDNRLRALVLGKLRQYADSGRCVILVSHELGDLARHCDRILVVRNGGITCPFAGDPDDRDPEGPGPDGGNRSHLLPVAKRDDAEVARVTTVLTRLIWDSGGDAEMQTRAVAPAALPATAGTTTAGTAPATGTASDAAGPAPVADPASRPASRTGGTLGLRGHVWRYAFTEVYSRRQALMRTTVALLLAAATAGFTYLSNLAGGAVAFLRDTTLGPDEFITRMSARNPTSENDGYFTPKQVAFIEALPGLRTDPATGRTLRPTFLQEAAVFVVGASGLFDNDTVASVPLGDHSLQPVADAEFPTAQTGVRYLQGKAFDGTQTDCASVIVTKTWLRRKYWRQADWDDPAAPDAGKIPEFIQFRLDADPPHLERPERARPPGLDGRVKVPLAGVIEYPPAVLRDSSQRPQMYVPEMFLRRLRVWKSHHPMVYPAGTDAGGKLVPEYDLMVGFRITVKDPMDKEWATKSAVVERIREAFGGVNPEVTPDGALDVKLSPATIPNNRITPEVFLKDEWATVTVRREERPGIAEIIKLNAFPDDDARKKAPDPVVEIRKESVLSKFGSLPPAEEAPPAYRRVLLRFGDLKDVLPAQQMVKREFAKMETDVRYDRALQIFQDVGALVERGSQALMVAFTVGLLFLVGITAYMHIAGKSGDIGILRAYGLSAPGIAWVYQVELAMFLLPACLLGIITALAATTITNDWVAERLLSLSASATAQEGDPLAAAQAASKPGTADDKPKVVFANLRQGAGEVVMASLTTLGLTALMLLPASLVPIMVVRRLSIVDCLRAAGG